MSSSKKNHIRLLSSEQLPDGQTKANIELKHVLPKDNIDNVNISEIAKGLLDTLDENKGSNEYSLKVLTETTSMLVPIKLRRALAEIGIDIILQVLGETSYDDWLYPWSTCINLLTMSLQTTAAVKRMITAKSVIKMIIGFLALDFDALVRCKAGSKKKINWNTDINDCEKPTIEKIAYETLAVLCTCVYGSKPNAEYWEELFNSFDFEHMIQVDGRKKEWDRKKDVANVLYALRYLHQCKFNYSHKVVAFIEKNCEPSFKKKMRLPSEAYTRLAETHSYHLSHGYMVACASPKCCYITSKDGMFKLCGQCMPSLSVLLERLSIISLETRP